MWKICCVWLMFSSSHILYQTFGNPYHSRYVTYNRSRHGGNNERMPSFPTPFSRQLWSEPWRKAVRCVCVLWGSWRFHCFTQPISYIDGVLQDCTDSIANALELPQSFTKPWICLVHIPTWYVHRHALWHGVPLHNLLFALMQLSLNLSLRNGD